MQIPTCESEVEQLVKTDAVNYGCVLLRNNSGALTDKTGRTVRYGLGAVSKKHDERIKSSDEIGFTRVVITPQMVGKTVAIFTAVEVKGPGWAPKNFNAREEAQNAFLTWVGNNGAFAFFTNSVDDFRRKIKMCLESLGA